MKTIEFSSHLHWLQVLMRVVGSILVLLGCVIIIALMRQTCHLSSMLICATALIVLNVCSYLLSKKNRYVISNDFFIVEEYFLFGKNISLSIPISMIDECKLSNSYPYHSIHIVVHGHPYILRNVISAEAIIKVINDKKMD